MIRDWPPTFNVLYVPGTVRTLLAFARSLAEHSPFRFRLVSNACTADEEALLADAAARHPRLDFASLATTTVLPHGEALQRRFRDESADCFAFVDSDVFATGRFLGGARALLAEHAAVFSGLPVWQAPEERVMPARFVFMSGRFSETEGGLCLGVSYCALYRRAAIETVMERTAVSFRRAGWSDLSHEQRALLSRMKLAKRRYDTAKLLNVMLAGAGFSSTIACEPDLLHVGALSSDAARPRGLTVRIGRALRDLVEESWPGPVPRKGSRERDATRAAFARRRLAEDYVRHVLAGRPPDGGPAAAFPAALRPQLVALGSALVALRHRSGADPAR